MLKKINKVAKHHLCCVDKDHRPYFLSAGLIFSFQSRHIEKKMSCKKLWNSKRFLIQRPKQGLNVESVIRNKCLFLFAVLDVLLLLVTWSSSSTLIIKGQPLKSVTVRAAERRKKNCGTIPANYKVNDLISEISCYVMLWAKKKSGRPCL